MKEKILKNIFLSSIYQNAGKTTMTLGLYKALRDRKYKVAFMKPVGQKVVPVGDMSIDKDSYLIGEVFKCSKRFKDMSPVTVGKGFTEKYILNPQKNKLVNLIMSSFEKLKKRKDIFLVEGTGHAGVGSVIDLSNAEVANILHSKVIIISEGGIGKCIDEIMLNKALFDLKKVDILGVIVNKVLPEKYDKIKDILGKGLQRKGIKLLGVIPNEPLLSSPSIEQIKNWMNLELLSGTPNITRRVKHTIVAAMEPHNMVHHFKAGTLVLTSGDRVDNILLAVSSHLVYEDKGSNVAGIILTGGLTPDPKIINLLKKSQIPVLITGEDTYTVAAKIMTHICKIEKTDREKIDEATRLVKKYVDINAILKSF